MPALADPPRWALPGLTSASGCFETMRAYQGKIFRLDAHLDRLDASLEYLGVRMAGGGRAAAGRAAARRGLRAKLVRALERSELLEAVVRVALVPDQGLGPVETGRMMGRIARPSIVVRPVEMPTERQYRLGIRVAVVPARKPFVNQIDPQAKYSARLGSKLAVVDARLRNADEAIFMDGLGFADESTASNLGVIKRGEIVMAPAWLGLLGGITWDVVFELARVLKLRAREEPMTRHDLYNADEVFLSSTIKEILPVTQIDGRRIGAGIGGPVSKRLLGAFRALVKRELHLQPIVTKGVQ